MKKLILFVGLLVIIVVTICTFKFEAVKYFLTRIEVNQEYKEKENEYYLEDNFLYVNNYKDLIIKSQDNFVDSLYYLLNSGNTSLTVYCDYDYLECKDMINEVNKDNSIVSTLANYVHPYNNFTNINFNYDGYYKTEINIEHVYNTDTINIINNKVDEIINNNIKDDMTNREKIKVIHDYLISNVTYDSKKLKDENDNTYQSNTAYGALIEGYALCSGYTDAMAIFLNKFGILNYRIGNDIHTWNLVYLNNEWLHLDVTWDDPVDYNGTDTYFLIDTKSLEELKDDYHYYDKNIYKEAN